MAYELMTVDLLKQALPKNLLSNATQEFADKVNAVTNDPEVAEMIRNNFLSYSKVLTEGKYKTEDYLNAVAYCTFKIMGYSNKDAYAKAHPERWKFLLLRGATDKDISAYVAAYHKNKMVNQILEQSTIPGWLLNQDVFQRAINTQLELMIDPMVSSKVRCDAANSLLTHLKPPETRKVELDVNVKQHGGIADLMATMTQLAERQIAEIQSGGSARDIGRISIVGRADQAIDAEFTQVPVQLEPPKPSEYLPPALPDTHRLPEVAVLPEVAMPTTVGEARALEAQLLGMGTGVSLFDRLPPVDKPVEPVPAEPEPEELEPVEDARPDWGEGTRPTTRRPSLFDPMGSDA